MKIDRTKLDILLARKCKSVSSLRTGVSPQTLLKIRKGGNVNPATAGRIAKALGVDVTEIIETEDNK